MANINRLDEFESIHTFYPREVKRAMSVSRIWLPLLILTWGIVVAASVVVLLRVDDSTWWGRLLLGAAIGAIPSGALFAYQTFCTLLKGTACVAIFQGHAIACGKETEDAE